MICVYFKILQEFYNFHTTSSAAVSNLIEYLVEQLYFCFLIDLASQIQQWV